MQSPKLLDPVIGNRLSLALIITVTAGLCVGWIGHLGDASDDVPWYVPVAFLWLSGSALKCRRRLVTYREWQADWNEVAGHAPAIAERRRKRRRFLALTFATCIWLGLGFEMQTHAADCPDLFPIVQGAFYFLTGLGGILIQRRLKPGQERRRAKRGAKRDREFTVTICIGVPWRSPGPKDFSDLPAYCKHLIASPTA